MPSPDSLRTALERFLSDHVEGWSVGDTEDRVNVTLPPGCDTLADRLEARYGASVRVERNVVITPVQ